MSTVAMPGVPVSLDFSIITPDGYEEARKAWHQNVSEKQHDTIMIGIDFTNNADITQIQQEFAHLGKVSLPRHMTLLYIGEMDAIDHDVLQTRVEEFASEMSSFDGKINGIAKFTNVQEVLVLLLDAPELSGFRQALREMFPEIKQDHGFTPHITLIYDDEIQVPELHPNIPVKIDTISVYIGDDRTDYPLSGNVVLKGGPGSGNFGHEGRPGKIGGSVPQEHISNWQKYDSDGNTIVYHGTKTDLIDDIFENGLRVGKKWMRRKPSVYFTVDKEEAIQWAENVASPGDWEIGLIEFSIPDEFDAGVIEDNAANEDFGWETAFRIEKDIPAEYIRAVYFIKTKFVAHDRGGPIPYDMIREVVSERHKERLCYAIVVLKDDENVALKGGPGSGHHGHAGRPGKVGGSASDNAPSAEDFIVHEETVHVTGQDYAIAGPLFRNLEIVKKKYKIKFEIVDDLQVVGYGHVAGLFDPEKRLIRIDSSMLNRRVDLNKIGYPNASMAVTGYPATVYHEVGHAIDFSSEPLYSENADFLDLYYADRQLSTTGSKEHLVSRYATADPAECWAENFSAYMVNPKWLEVHNPDMYEYFINLPEVDVLVDTKEFPRNKIEIVVGDQFIWIDVDESVVEKQLPIDDDSKANLISIRQGMFNDDVDTLAESMYIGEISIGQWEERMKKLVRELHSSVAAIGKGGWDEMTWADWGRLGPQLKEQYRYLHGFAEHIVEKRDTISIEAIKARAHMYGNAAVHSAYLIEAGQVISDMLPWIPRDGSTQCLTGCRCEWQLEIIGKEKDFNIVQAIWKLNPADHCDDCIDRDEFVHTMRVHKDIPVPKTIGGY